MSALIRQSHASNDKPLWLSSEGDITVDGTIKAGRFEASREIGQGSHVLMDETGTIKSNVLLTGAATPFPPAGDLIIATDQKIRLCQLGSDQTNTTFTPSVAGTGLDNLTVGGSVGCNKLKLRAGIVCGTSSIAPGQTTVIIPATGIEASSMVFLTFSSPAQAGPASGGAQGNLTVDPLNFVPGTSFTVEHVGDNGVIQAVVDNPCDFNWMIINFV